MPRITFNVGDRVVMENHLFGEDVSCVPIDAVGTVVRSFDLNYDDVVGLNEYCSEECVVVNWDDSHNNNGFETYEREVYSEEDEDIYETYLNVWCVDPRAIAPLPVGHSSTHARIIRKIQQLDHKAKNKLLRLKPQVNKLACLKKVTPCAV